MRNVFVLVLMCLCMAGFAQTGYEDVVYLKNGSIIHGMIIEQVPNVSIKIKNKLGDVIFYKYEEIEKLIKEELPKQATAAQEVKRSDTVDHLKTMAHLEASGLFGLAGRYFSPSIAGSRYNGSVAVNHAFQLSLSVTKRVRPRLYVGGGLGFSISPQRLIPSYFFTPIGTASPSYSILVPGYADVRYMILKGKHTPYIAGQGGAAFFASGGKIGGGALLGLQFGGRFSVSKKVGLSIFTGYRMQHIAVEDMIQYTDEAGNNTIQVRTHVNYLLHFLSFGGGVSF